MRLYLLALLAAMICAAWSNALYSPFQFDDEHFIQQNPSVTFHAPISVRAGRMLTLTTYRINYMLGGENTFGYHATNLGIHLINVILVFYLALSLIGEFPAFVAAGIFGLHPLQTEAVTYLSSRPELLLTLFTITALLLARSGRLFLAFCACLFAILSKESGVVSIALVLAYLWHERRVSTWTLSSIGTIGLLLAGYRYIHAGLVTSGRPLWEHAVIQNAQFWHYLTMLVYPVGLSIDHDPERIPLAVQIIALVGTVTIALHPYLGKKWREHNNGKNYCDNRHSYDFHVLTVAWLAIVLIPRFLTNIPETLAEHHMYLPMVALSILMAHTLTRIIDYAETLSQLGATPWHLD